jgi:hypothetical protein
MAKKPGATRPPKAAPSSPKPATSKPAKVHTSKPPANPFSAQHPSYEGRAAPWGSSKRGR